MTLDDLIKEVDLHLPGNRFDNQQKTRWLNEIEGKIFDEIETKFGFPIEKWPYDFLPSLIKIIRRSDGTFTYAPIEAERLPANEKKDEDKEVINDCCNTYVRQIDPLNMAAEGCGCCQRKKITYELIPYRYETDTETPLIVPDRFCDVYIHYILAKIHQADSEIDNYNNEVIMFDASYKDYAAYRIRQYR